MLATSPAARDLAAEVAFLTLASTIRRQSRDPRCPTLIIVEPAEEYSGY
jgi:hypothetical protein